MNFSLEMPSSTLIDDDDNYIAPTILTNVPDNAKVMEQEIFGPVMPVKTFNNLDEVIEEINGREKPLALYIYSKNKNHNNYNDNINISNDNNSCAVVPLPLYPLKQQGGPREE